MVLCICLAYFVRRCCFPEEPTEGSFYCILDVFSIPFVKMTSSKRVSGGFVLRYFTLFSIFLCEDDVFQKSPRRAHSILFRVCLACYWWRGCLQKNLLWAQSFCVVHYMFEILFVNQRVHYLGFCICLAYLLWRWYPPEESSEGSFYCVLYTLLSILPANMSSRRVPGGFIL